ncbi:hypothetical protein HF883_10155 [Cloacibacillus porcorum]|uniref:hypothetical protein n=1 Tax=Cloacibacillus porcorum TaxID=1197717 RepID=UPI0014596932|nr:hypothetical protein [Cloacibacillus porcorum]NMF18583.1 hypothetical protein [Cloacibacillus porcorum]
MADSNDNQNRSIMLRVRVSEKEAQSLRIAAAVKDDSIQDILHAAVLQYIKDTKLPDDLLIK